MFEVRTNSPFDDQWEERDDAIHIAAGRVSAFSGCGVGSCADAGRDHGWHVPTLEEAQEMKERLECVPLVKVVIREK